MPNPSVHVLCGIERIRNVERSRRAGHQLHQPHRPFAGDRVGVVIRLHFDDRPNQVRVHIVPGGRLENGCINLLLSKDAIATDIEMRIAVQIAVDFGRSRAGGTNGSAAGRNRFPAMFGRAPVRKARTPGCGRRRTGRAPCALIVHVNLVAKFVRSSRDGHRPRTRLGPHRWHGKKGGRGCRGSHQGDLHAHSHIGIDSTRRHTCALEPYLPVT